MNDEADEDHNNDDKDDDNSEESKNNETNDEYDNASEIDTTNIEGINNVDKKKRKLLIYLSYHQMV